MKKSKLIQILKTFSPEEMKEFEKFISSPFFGCKNFVVNFFKELKKHYPEFKDENIQKEKIYSKLYKGKEYNDGLMRRMISDLITMTEEYFMYKRFKNTPSYIDQCLIYELRMRKLNNIFETKSNKISNELSNQKFIDNSLLLNIYLIENEIFNYRVINRNKEFADNLESAVNALLIFFIDVLYSYINHINYFNFEYEIKSELIKSFLANFNYSEFIKSIEHIENKYTYYVKLVYYTFSIINNMNDESSYWKLRKLLNYNKEYISANVRLGCFVVLSAFCINQNMKNDSKYVTESFEINDIILKEKLFLIDSKYLQLSFCRSLIIICKRLNRYEYISDFIKLYSRYIHPESRDSFINYCNALIMFSNKNYGKTLEYSAIIDLDWPAFKKDIKILKTMSYYELGYLDSVYSEIDSFKHFLSYTDTLQEGSIVNGKNFIGFVMKLLKLKERNDINELGFFKKQVEEENNINEKTWLLEKIKELEK